MEQLDLVVDLNSQDDTGLPWAFLDAAAEPDRIVPGAHVLVGSGDVRAVARVADVDGDIVHVVPLHGPVANHRHLLSSRAIS